MKKIDEYLFIADCGIIPLRKLSLFWGALPSKLFDYMACGLPILLGIEGEAKDVIEKIEFPANGDAENNEQGVLRFAYLEDIEQSADEFAEPTKIKVRKAKRYDSMGMLWLTELAQGTLGQ